MLQPFHPYNFLFPFTYECPNLIFIYLRMPQPFHPYNFLFSFTYECPNLIFIYLRMPQPFHPYNFLLSFTYKCPNLSILNTSTSSQCPKFVPSVALIRPIHRIGFFIRDTYQYVTSHENTTSFLWHPRLQST